MNGVCIMIYKIFIGFIKYIIYNLQNSLIDLLDFF